VQDLTDDRTVERETALVKVYARASSRAGLITLAKAHAAKVVDVGVNTVVFELTETPEKVEAFVSLLQPVGVKEMIRSGRIVMVRGTSPASPKGTWAAQADGHGD
jgi:acetolactate synthase I/III small subunit